MNCTAKQRRRAAWTLLVGFLLAILVSLTFRAVHSDARAAFCVGSFAVALLSAFADKNTDSTKGKTVGLRNACPYDS